MRTFPIAVVFLLIVFSSCNMRMPKFRLIGEEQLPTTLFSIDPTRDTVLNTPHGAVIKIAAGSLDAGAEGRVLLEVKEAYTIADITKGRLLTRSKGQELSSGGMIFIGPAGGQTLTIRKPIHVSIPTKTMMDGMKVYKGVKDDRGDIDWEDPRPLAVDSERETYLAKGKEIFQSNCATCHGISRSLTGPALAWINERAPDKKWLYDYIHDNHKLLMEGDPYSCYLFNMYNKTPMPLFPHLGGEAIGAILLYISDRSHGVDSNSVPNYRLSFDSCVRYRRLTDSLKQLKQRRDALVGKKGSRINQRWFDRTGNQLTGTHPLIVNAPPVVVVEHPSEYYEFDIDSFGWFNVDILITGLEGVEVCELTVSVKGGYRNDADVFLVIPALKVFQRGGLLGSNADEFGFLTVDGKIPLPQGAQAYVLCMGESKGRSFFGVTQWTISRSQHLAIEPAAMTKEDINRAIGQLSFDRLVIQAKDSKNAAQIRSLDTAMAEITKLIPKSCDCVCSFDRDTAYFVEQ
jgi:mono/diheme cytochrome c family protein